MGAKNRAGARQLYSSLHKYKLNSGDYMLYITTPILQLVTGNRLYIQLQGGLQWPLTTIKLPMQKNLQWLYPPLDTESFSY